MSDNKNLIPSSENREAVNSWPLEASWNAYTEARPDDPDAGEVIVWLKEAPDLDLLSNAISGHVSRQTNDRGLKMALVDGAHLDEDYRGKGIGKRMYRAFTRLAMEHGATHLGGINPTEAALKTRLSVFGPDRMKFYDKTVTDSDEVVSTRTEITAEECQKRVDAAERRRSYQASLSQKYGLDDIMDLVDYLSDEEKANMPKYSSDNGGYYVVVDLTGLDTSDWEADVPVKEI